MTQIDQALEAEGIDFLALREGCGEPRPGKGKMNKMAVLSHTFAIFLLMLRGTGPSVGFNYDDVKEDWKRDYPKSNPMATNVGS